MAHAPYSRDVLLGGITIHVTHMYIHTHTYTYVYIHTYSYVYSNGDTHLDQYNRSMYLHALLLTALHTSLHTLMFNDAYNYTTPHSRASSITSGLRYTTTMTA